MRKKTKGKYSLKWVCMLLPFYFCPCWGQSICWRSVDALSQTIFFDQSIMVRHMKLIFVLYLPLRLYCLILMRSTHNAHQGVVMTSFDSTWPFFWLHLLFLARLDGIVHNFQYEFQVYLFVCWEFYSILRRIIPVPQTSFSNKLISFFAATMAWSGFGPYHGLWFEDAPSKCVIVTPTLGGMISALGLDVCLLQPELYKAYYTAFLFYFFML